MIVIHHRTGAARLDSFLSSGIWLCHFILLSESLTPTCSISHSGWLFFFLLIYGECLSETRSSQLALGQGFAL
jgi:hypothetical protein